MRSTTDVPGTTRPRGLPVVVLSLAVVGILGARESVSGLETVASTASGVGAVLLFLTGAAVVLRMTAGRSARRWPRFGLGGLAIVSVALVAVVLVSTIRAHTASSRFADEMAHFPLPKSYVTESAAGVDAQHARKPEHTVRVWRVPAGADACRDIESAFRSWTHERIETFSRGDTCSVAANASTDKSEVTVTADGSTVILEMWLEGSSLIHF